MEQIGRYQILGELGRGAMGIVYRAQDPAIGRIVAIKTIRLSNLTDPVERERLRDRLFREAQAAGVLSHPNIVTIYDVAEAGGTAYVSMEFVDGPPLERIFESGPPPSRGLVLAVLRQTANALDYAHGKGVIHRDIKPANIMLQEGAQAKITDFGVAKTLSHQMTQGGAMMGTPNYMSLEQVQGHNVDGRADQFALAVIAYEILTGEKPFTGEYLPSLLYKIVREQPIAPQRLNPGLGTQVETALFRALSKDPEDRFQTCSEFMDAFGSGLEASGNWQPLARGASQTMPTLSGAPRPRRKAADPVLAPLPVPGRKNRDEPATNPLLKSLIGMLVAIGLVGLVLFGAQQILFNHGNDEPAQTAASEPAPSSIPQAAKPSPIGGDNTLPGDAPPAPAPAQTQARPKQPPSESAAPALERQQSGSEYTIQFVSDPPGANVTIDSSQSCRTPCMLSLPAGRHAVNTNLQGYRPYPKVLNVPQESDVFLSLTQATATLSITSTPDGAAVQLNGVEQKNVTPLRLSVAPGTYRVRVTKDGVPLDFDVTIKDGEFVAKNVSF